ncbi:MAG: HDOD domain-containing protein [Ilumatobacter sp.]|uniref:HDOD domain-containing protein n=1 Tax=Ilumatobacter sp. TaxID=1967498 RepID=UPI00391C350D
MSDLSPEGLLTIVFVDDDPVVLQSLRRSTRRFRHVWDVHVAEGAAAALELFDRLGNIDIVITDMRMPGMDGAELLAEIRERSPHTARIVLSGQAGRDAALRAVGPAQQFLSKPVEIDALAQVVNDIRNRSRGGLYDPIRTLIGQTDRLPSPPTIFKQILDMVDSGRWTINGVAEVLSADVALTAEVLKLVNSAFFGYFGDVKSVERAVSLLGVDLVRTVVLGNTLYQPASDLESWLDLELLDHRCKSVAYGARALALRDSASADDVGAAFLAGMVNEIGLLVMARVPGMSVNVTAPLNTHVYPDVERALFGADRFDVGCHLLRLWGFPVDVVDAIDRLGDPDVFCSDGVPFYLHASRRLVLEGGFDPFVLASVAGADPGLDNALELVRAGEPFESSDDLIPA